MGNSHRKRTGGQQADTLKYGRRIGSRDEFWSSVGNGQWYAVWRPGLRIYHHFLISEVSSSRYHAKVIHYTGSASRYLESFGKAVGEVVEEDIYRDDKTLLDIPNNLYVVSDPGSPPSEEAVARARQRVGERQYSMAYNNCEHFVTYVLTGKPRSSQYEMAAAGKKMAALLFDELPQLLKKTLSEGWSGCLFAMRRTVASVAQSAYKAALPALGIASAAMNGLAALAEAFVETNKLEAQVEAGTMSRRDCDNARAKLYTVQAISAVGGVVGAVLGQLFLPIPFLGGWLGGLIGGFLGSLVGRAVGAISASLGIALKEKYF